MLTDTVSIKKLKLDYAILLYYICLIQIQNTILLTSYRSYKQVFIRNRMVKNA